MSEDADIEPARKKYAEARPKYERLAREVLRVLNTKLREAGLAPVSVTHRAKDLDSFAEKITRKNYTDPLSQMTDLAGVRVVCAYKSEFTKVAQVIEANFKVEESIDKARDLGVDRMGYNGKAFVIVLGDGYGGGVYEAITDLRCENSGTDGFAGRMGDYRPPACVQERRFDAGTAAPGPEQRCIAA